MNNNKHYAAAITAFLIWGFFPIPLRLLSDYSSGQILYFRILFSVLILVGVLFVKRRAVRDDIQKFQSHSTAEKRKTVFLTLIGGALLIVNWLTFIYIVNNVNIKTASFSYLICPVVTAVLGYVILKEKLSTIQWIAVLLCAVSCVMVGLNSAAELGFSFFTATTYALYLISQRKNQGYDRMFILGIQVALALAILSFFFGRLVVQTPEEVFFYGIILLIAALFTVIPLFLNLFALNRIKSATIGILMYLNPLVNFTVAFVVYDESVSTLQIVGYSIILVALVLFNAQNLSRLRSSS